MKTWPTLLQVIHSNFNWNDHVERVVRGGGLREYFKGLESGWANRRIELGFDDEGYCYIGISADSFFLYYYCPALIDQAHLVST